MDENPPVVGDRKFNARRQIPADLNTYAGLFEDMLEKRDVEFVHLRPRPRSVAELALKEDDFSLADEEVVWLRVTGASAIAELDPGSRVKKAGNFPGLKFPANPPLITLPLRPGPCQPLRFEAPWWIQR